MEEPPPPGDGSFASGECDEDDRRTGVVWVRIERKGDMRGVPVRVRVLISPGDVMGRMGRETRGIIVRRKGKRGSIRRIMVVVVVLVVEYFFCLVVCRLILSVSYYCGVQVSTRQKTETDCTVLYCTVMSALSATDGRSRHRDDTSD